MEHRCLSWHEKLWDIILEPGEGIHRSRSLLYPQLSAESATHDQPIQRLNVPYGETAFIYYVLSTPIKVENSGRKAPGEGMVSARPLGAVVAESMGKWLGHENIFEQKNIEIDVPLGGPDAANHIFQFNLAPNLGDKNLSAMNQMQNQNMQDGADDEIEEDKDIASDIGADDIDENKNVLLYFRMDEG